MSVKKNVWSHVQKCAILYLCENITVKEIDEMAEKKDNRHRTLTEARKAANKRYIDKFVEVKVRMTPEHRTEVQQHAQDMGESTTAFINRAIDETMARDKDAKK